MRLIADFAVDYPGGVCIAPVLNAPMARDGDGGQGASGATVLLGPSGCGKTTVLRAIAGLLTPRKGKIVVGDETWFDADARINVSTQRRGIGVVFQDYALFPHLSIQANIAYGLRGMEKRERTHRVEALMEVCGLTALRSRRPGEVSGGEQQRTALARAVAPRPRLLLLDEPLAALDEQTRRGVRERLSSLLTEFGIPVILVTHDLSEAISLGDQLVIMGAGKVLQQGTVMEVLANPASAAAGRAVGFENVLAAEISFWDTDDNRVRVGSATFRIEQKPSARDATDASRFAIKDRVYVMIRAAHVRISNAPANNADNSLQATVTNVERDAQGYRVLLDCGFPLIAHIGCAPTDPPPRIVGETLFATVTPRHISISPA